MSRRLLRRRRARAAVFVAEALAHLFIDDAFENRQQRHRRVARHPRNVRPCYPRDMVTSKEAAHTTTVALILALISGATALIGLLGAYSGLLAPLVGFMLLAAGSLPGDID